MSIWSTRPRLRWLVPALAAALVIGGGAAATAIAAPGAPELPPRSAAELLVDLQTARVDGFSGTVVQRADLGLPALPGTRERGSADLGTLLSGSNTLRVWYAGQEQIRVALLGTLGQSDIVRNGRDLWIWESGTNTATHRTLPDGPTFGPLPDALPMTPQEAADAALAALDPSTEVTTDGTATVAERAAYELILTPRDPASLIRDVRLAIDAEHGLPLRVQVYGAGEEPAFEVRFTQISFNTPDPEQFRFNPPPGVTVTEAEFAPGDHRADARPPVTVVGEGWTSVVVTDLPLDDLAPLELLPRTDGPWGSGWLLSGALFSALITDDGRVLAGAVTPERLTEIAADLDGLDVGR